VTAAHHSGDASGVTAPRWYGTRALLVILLGQSALLVWATRHAGFFADDWVLLSSAHAGAGVGWSSLRRAVFGHFAPGARAAGYVVQRFTPMDYLPSRVFIVLVALACTVVLWRILTLLVGPHPVVAASVAVVAWSPMWVPSVVWWSAALQSVFGLLLSLVCAYGVLRHVVTRRWWPLVYAVLSLTVGLLLYEKPILWAVLLPVLVGVVLSDSVLGGLRITLRHWRSWLVLAVPVVAYAVQYVVGKYGAAYPPPTGGQFGSFLWSAWGETFVPGLAGASPPRTIDPARPLALLLALQLIPLALVAVSVRRWRPAWRLWVLFAGFWLVNVGVVGYTRASRYGAASGRQARYLVENLPLLAVVVVVALVPLRAGLRAAAQDSTPPAPVLRRPAWAVVATVAAAVFATVCVLSAEVLRRPSPGADAGRYLRTLQADLRDPVHRGLLDVTVDPVLIPRPRAPLNRLSRLLALGDYDDVRFDDPADPPLVVGGDGHLRPAAFTVRETHSGSAAAPAGCNSATAGPIELTPVAAEQLPATTWAFVRLSVSGRGRAVVPVLFTLSDGTGGRERAVLDAQHPTSLVPLPAKGTAVKVEVGSAPGLCVTRLEVVVVRPA
jgi:hypothetical protein